MRAFRDVGCSVVSFSFERAGYNTDYDPEWLNISLGSVSHGAYYRRIMTLLKSLPLLARGRAIVREASFLYATNLDQAFLALFAKVIARSDVPVVYEVADIRSVLVRDGVVGGFARWLERVVLRRTSMLVVTSPAFIEHFFSAIQGFAGPYYLWENKVYGAVMPPRESILRQGALIPRHRGGREWVIGYFGVLRCRRSISLITTLAKQLAGRIRFVLRGIIEEADRKLVEDAISAGASITLGGSFESPRDLAELYGQVDLVWGLELVDEAHNSRWLLPNRLYESGYFRLPIVAPSGFEVGRYVEQKGMGWTLPEPFGESLRRFFETLSDTDYEVVRGRLHALPDDTFAGCEEARELCDLMDAQRRGGRKTT